MKKKIGLLIALSYMLTVIFSIGSQASYIQKNVASLQVADGSVAPSPTPFFYDPEDTSKVLITVNCGEGGSVTPNGKSVIDRGTDITFVFTPNEGYEVDKVTVAHGDEEAVEVTPLFTYEHTEVWVDNNLTVNVTFKNTGNSVNGLNSTYTLDETVEFTAKGTRMDIAEGLINGSSRWRPIGYRFNDSNDIILFDSDTFSGNARASVLKSGKHLLYVIFARQVYVEGEGWFYQTPVKPATLSLSSTKQRKMKLTAINEAELTLPFVQEDYVVDVKSFDFEVLVAATSVPTVEPTIVPTTVPTLVPTTEPSLAPTVTPTTEPTLAPTLDSTTEPTGSPIITPTPKLHNNDNTPIEKDVPSRVETPVNPKTGDSSLVVLWAILTIVTGLGTVIFSRKVTRK